MVYSATAVGGSYLGGKLISIVGRKSFGVFVMLIHIGMYVFSLFWTPTETNLWMVYLISGITGLGEGTVIQLNQSTCELSYIALNQGCQTGTHDVIFCGAV